MKRRVIKLAPQVPAWCDAKNNIYLSSNGRREKELKEGIDMKAINKGIKAGLIILQEDEVKIEVPKEEPVAVEVKAAKKTIEKIKAKKAKEKVQEVKQEVKEEVVEKVEEVKKEDDNKEE